jgi:hypothetical protein
MRFRGVLKTCNESCQPAILVRVMASHFISWLAA